MPPASTPPSLRPGQRPPPDSLIDVAAHLAAYQSIVPDPENPAQRVAFGTSGHRGSAVAGSFNEAHIVAMTAAICRFRAAQRIDGPLFLGIDTHALSAPAGETALEVLAAHGVEVMIDAHDGFTPTPAISHAILRYNRGRTDGLADGIVVTPSHNPPEDGGFKYNPPHGGPADTDITRWIEDEANRLLATATTDIPRHPIDRARRAGTTHRHDYLGEYVATLGEVIDLDAIRAAGPRLGVDPLGGAGVAYWGEIASRHRLPLEVVSTTLDPTFGFMTVDWDGRIRMDPSSAHAMQRLLEVRDRFDVAWACDTDHDRHGIVANSTGLLKPNDFLATSIDYLLTHRPEWSPGIAIGKTMVSSAQIDRVIAHHGRAMLEVPVGFKWFVDGLTNGSLGFVGEESAGATLLCRNGEVWTTDKDGIVLGLLAAEMTAVTGRDPGELHRALAAEVGPSWYERIDAPATPEQKAKLAALTPEHVTASSLAGDPIVARQTTAPGNGASFGGLKVTTDHGWIAARPSGTEAVYKLYAESQRGPEHLEELQREGRELLDAALRAPPSH